MRVVSKKYIQINYFILKYRIDDDYGAGELIEDLNTLLPFISTFHILDKNEHYSTWREMKKMEIFFHDAKIKPVIHEIIF